MGATRPTTAVLLSPAEFGAIMDKIDLIDSLQMRVAQLEQTSRGPVIDPFLTVEEAAALLKVSTKTVYRRIERRELKTVLLSGKSYGIRKSEVEKYLNRNGEPRK